MFVYFTRIDHRQKLMENPTLEQRATEIAKNPVEFFNSVAPETITKVISSESSEELKEDAILFSVAALNIFVIENFTGPSVMELLSKENLDALRDALPGNFEASLNLDGEYVHSQAKYLELIWVPYNLLQRYNGPKEWICRAAMTLQRCITGVSPTICDIVLPIVSGVEKVVALRLFHKYIDFFDAIEECKSDLGLEFKLSGKLGKRTKFQQDSKSQFILEVSNCASKRDTEVSGNKVMVTELTSCEREVKLEEEAPTLERPKMDDEFEVPKLNVEEMALLLQEAKAILERKLGDEIREEKSIPILTTILEQKPTYEIQTVALYEKSKIEQNEHRTQQRAALQLQSIIDDFDKTETPATDRIQNFFLLEHPPLWDVKKEMGIQMMKIGAARTAADIFIQNKMWDELGICCEIAHDPSIAVDVLEKEEPSPLVCTILGEQKKDKDILEQAWELSEHHMSRPKRSLGILYLKEGEWDKCIDNLGIALRINPLYPEAQYALGCAYMRVENFEKAVAAFQEVVAQKGDDSECYSNLAICFTTIGKHEEAHKAITQAIRFSRDNAKIWENFIIISINAEKYDKAVFGLEEMNRIFPKWCNVPLIYDVELHVIESKGDFKRFMNVMEKISQTANCGFDFWTIYADIAKAAQDYESEFEMRNNVIKALEAEGKISEAEIFDRLVVAVEKYVEASKNIEGKARSARSRVRVTLKKYEDDFSSLESYKRLVALSETL